LHQGSPYTQFWPREKELKENRDSQTWKLNSSDGTRVETWVPSSPIHILEVFTNLHKTRNAHIAYTNNDQVEDFNGKAVLLERVDCLLVLKWYFEHEEQTIRFLVENKSILPDWKETFLYHALTSKADNGELPCTTEQVGKWRRVLLITGQELYDVAVKEGQELYAKYWSEEFELQDK